MSLGRWDWRRTVGQVEGLALHWIMNVFTCNKERAPSIMGTDAMRRGALMVF